MAATQAKNGRSCPSRLLASCQASPALSAHCSKTTTRPERARLRRRCGPHRRGDLAHRASVEVMFKQAQAFRRAAGAVPR